MTFPNQLWSCIGPWVIVRATYQKFSWRLAFSAVILVTTPMPHSIATLIGNEGSASSRSRNPAQVGQFAVLRASGQKEQHHRRVWEELTQGVAKHSALQVFLLLNGLRSLHAIRPLTGNSHHAWPGRAQQHLAPTIDFCLGKPCCLRV